MGYKDTNECLKSFSSSLPQLKAFCSLAVTVRGPGPAERCDPLTAREGACVNYYPVLVPDCFRIHFLLFGLSCISVSLYLHTLNVTEVSKSVTRYDARFSLPEGFVLISCRSSILCTGAPTPPPRRNCWNKRRVEMWLLAGLRPQNDLKQY